MTTLYEVHALAIGGRKGRVTTADIVLGVRLTMPRAVGGNGKSGANPE